MTSKMTMFENINVGASDEELFKELSSYSFDEFDAIVNTVEDLQSIGLYETVIFTKPDFMREWPDFGLEWNPTNEPLNAPE